jgi:ribosomal-protein-alanine N-acetyltransferase
MRWWDLDDVLNIEREAFPETAWTAAMFWSELAGDPHSRNYFAAVSAEGVLVGYAGLLANPPVGDVQTIAVAQAARGTGVGAHLLDLLLDQAGRRECTEVLLEVAEGNAAAIGLYESRGFASIARRRDYYGPGRDAIAMRCRPIPAPTSNVPGGEPA